MTVQALKVHVAINVRDLSKSIEFYSSLFSLEPSKVRSGYAKFDVANPPLNLSLNEHAFQDASALSHLGIQVASTEDVFTIREQWHQRGLITRDEMQTDCCFATQDKTWVLDPDGNEWEVFVVLKDNLPEKAEKFEAVASCCAPPSLADQAVNKSATQCACATASLPPEK